MPKLSWVYIVDVFIDIVKLRRPTAATATAKHTKLSPPPIPPPRTARLPLPHNLHSKFMRQLLSIFDLMTIIVIILIKLPTVRWPPRTLSLSFGLSVYATVSSWLSFSFLAKLMPCFLPHSCLAWTGEKKTQRKPLDIYAFLWLMNFLACLTRLPPAFHIRLHAGCREGVSLALHALVKCLRQFV